jgi:puromycin-sensitive aminopeptidase
MRALRTKDTVARGSVRAPIRRIEPALCESDVRGPARTQQTGRMTDQPTAVSAYRLPRTVTPSRYDIELRLDPAMPTYEGSVDVAITAHQTVTEIVLNANDLSVETATILTEDGSMVEVATLVPDAEAERITLRLGSSLPPGRHTVRIGFTARLSDDIAGMYRSRYRSDDGSEHVIITNDFEATDARRSFPCWDEPDAKATFAITLVVPDGLTALTNTPETGREPAEPGFTRVRFATSMVMSTYLVCVVVGPLALTPAAGAGGVPMRVACRPEKVHLTGYANEVGRFALDWFAEYFGIPYPEQKLDHAAIPDFGPGAMENLGLVTYRETLLLLDPATAAHDERLAVAETIAHELAHMWFGDLVTMRWWNGVWLNEAFATFMSYLCLDAMEPSWRVFDGFQRLRSIAFEVDSLESTRPIEFPVESPDDASGMFDVLTYFKGGAVLRMIEQWLGPQRFRAGIQRYLAAHAYGNTETHDLWDALEAESGQPVRRIMDAWIFQPGYPVVDVRLDGDTIRLSAHRFAPSLATDDSSWPVPLLLRQVTPDRELVEAVLLEAGGLEHQLAHPGAMVVANAGSAGFVRTFYDDELRARLLEQAALALTPGERYGLVDDAWAAVVSGEAPVSSFLDLVSGFAWETAPSVWHAIITGLSWCDRFVDGEPREEFRQFVRALVRPALDRLGWEPDGAEGDLDRALRGDLFQALGVLGNDPATQAKAREIEARSRSGAPTVPAVAAAAVDVVAFVGGPAEYDAFRAYMDEAPTPQEQARYRYALVGFRSAALMQRTLELATSDAIRPQDAPFVLSRAERNRDLGEMAWRFVRDHWDELVPRFAPSNVITLALGATSLTTTEQVADVQRFFAEHDISQSHKSLVQMMEHQRVLEALRARASVELRTRFGG